MEKPTAASVPPPLPPPLPPLSAAARPMLGYASPTTTVRSDLRPKLDVDDAAAGCAVVLTAAATGIVAIALLGWGGGWILRGDGDPFIAALFAIGGAVLLLVSGTCWKAVFRSAGMVNPSDESAP